MGRGSAHAASSSSAAAKASRRRRARRLQHLHLRRPRPPRPDPAHARRCAGCARAEGGRLHRLSRLQRLEPAGGQAARRQGLRNADPLDRARRAGACRLRVGLYDGQEIGIPYVVVSGKTTPMSHVSFQYADESDKGPYPIPANVPIEGDPHPDGGDRHALIVDRDTCTLYELYALHRHGKRLGRGLGRDLEPRLEQAPAGGVDVGRRRGAADPPRPRSLRRGGGRERSTTPCASPLRRPAAPTSIPRGTTRAARPARRCRRWDYGYG